MEKIVDEIILELESINCIDKGKDPGNELEVYGEIGYYKENKFFTLWKCDRRFAVNISEDKPLKLHLFNKDPVLIIRDEIIQLYGKLKEADIIKKRDDILLCEPIDISMNDILVNGQGEKIEEMYFRSKSEIVMAKYIIKNKL